MGGQLKSVNDFKLTPLQQRLVDLYLIDPSKTLTELAIEAGYSKKGASVQATTVLHKPQVVEYISQRQAEMLVETKEAQQITFDYKVRKLAKIIERCIIDQDDSEPLTMSKTNAYRVGIAAIAELNKMQGHYAADKRVTANFNVDSDPDLSRLDSIMQQILTKRRDVIRFKEACNADD